MKKARFKFVKALAVPAAAVLAAAGAHAQVVDGSEAISEMVSDVAPYAAAGILLATAVASAVVGIKWVKKFIGRAS
jgi:hypothetical protein